MNKRPFYYPVGHSLNRLALAILLTISTLFTHSLFAQTCDSTFIKRIGSYGMTEQGRKIVPLQDGNLLIGGNKDNASLLLKITPQGEVIWERVFDLSPTADYFYEMIIDSEGMLVLVGRYAMNSNTVSFIMRYDYQNDMVLWTVKIPDPSSVLLDGILEKTDGNYIAFGTTNYYKLIIEVDKTDGSLKWDRSYNTGNPDAFRDAILIDSAIYTANIQRYGTVLSKTRPGVSKLNLDGSQVWTRNYLKSLSAVATIHATNIASVNDTLAILGYGNLTYVEPYPYKIQFFTTDLDGNLHWAKQYDLPGNYQYSKDLIALPDGYLLLAEITQYFATELLVMKIDKEGQKVWAKTIGGPYHESAWSFAVMGEYLVIVGNTKSFDEEGDIILCKIALDGSAVGDECTIVADAVINTTNIASPYSGQHLMQPKTYNYTLTTETLASSISPASPNTDMPGCGCIPYLCNILIENPGFENGLTGWNITGEVAISPDAPTGTKAVEICGLDDGSVGQIYPAQQGESFTASVWGKITDPDYAAAINLRFLDGSFTPLTAGEDRQLIKSHVYEQYFMKATAPPGTAYVHFLAWKERDNCAYFDDVRLCKDGDPIFFPDLTVEGLSIPNNPVLQGSSLSVEYTISNIGTATTSIGFNVDFYISTSNTLDQNSILLASYTQQPYAIGATANLTSNPILPNSLQPGNYYLIAIVDKSQTIIELDEGNNKISFPFSVDAPGLCDGTITLTSQAEVDAFPNCPTINGDLVISGNDITDLTLLSTLVEITGALAIQNNASLATLAGLENVMQANILIVQNNPLLNSLSPLSNLTKASMTTLAIENNDQLVSLTGLEGISGVGQIRINYNDNLLNLDGLQNLSTITGQFLISGNANLNNINALSQISAVGSDLLVLNNDKLGNLSGLSQLANIGRDLIVVGANALVNLDGLQNLIAVGEELVFQDNALLENLDGLASLTSTQSLIVQDNANLAACCAVFPLLNAGTISGSITIENNLPGCNSEQEIEDTCTPVGSYIDLELHLAQPNESPAQWTSYATTATLTNNGDAPATGIQVSFAKPAGVVYTGGNEYTASQGSFNPNGNEVWTVSSLAPGQSATLTVNYFLLQNTLPTAYAQVTAANEDDVDSTPNNGTPPSVNEDDEASTAPPTNGPIICAGSVILESQAEVDAFQGCEIIEGQLTIRSPFGINGASSDITDLTPLLSITKVTGVIVIQNNDSLFNLIGLDNITSSNGIVVQSCENINSIQALSGISGEVNVIKISGNPSLTNIDGLEGITKTHNTAEIDNNSTLQNLNGLSGLVEVNDVHLFIHTNPLLTDIQGLSNLTHINTDLIIGNCDGLENLNGLHNLVYAKSFILAGNDLLTDVSAVTSLTDVDITFFVANNPLLSDCCIFTDLLNNNNIVGITIENNAPGCNSEQDIEASCGPVICTGDVILESQAEVDAFAGCTKIDGILIIEGTDIVDLSPLMPLQEVTGQISIQDCPNLTSLDGLNNLELVPAFVLSRNDDLADISALSKIGGNLTYLSITENHQLYDLMGLHGVTHLDYLLLQDNNSLATLQGLNNLTHIGNDFKIIGNQIFDSFYALDKLVSIGGDFQVTANPNLRNFYRMLDLESIGGSFLVSLNPKLEDFTGLSGLLTADKFSVVSCDGLLSLSGINQGFTANEILVHSNGMLSDCCFLNYMLKNNIAATVDIYDNALGCNNNQEIMDGCGPVICTGVIQLNSQAQVNAFNCTEIINGILVISGSDIVDLTPLSVLTNVTHEINITNNNSLTSLAGLENTQGTKRLYIRNNPLLEDISALQSLSGDFQEIIVSNNGQLLSLSGLEGVIKVGILEILYNANLLTINGLPNLTETTNLLIVGNSSLQNVDGLDALKVVKNNFFIINNPALANLHGLNSLTNVNLQFDLKYLPMLSNFNGLEKLTTVGVFIINDNAILENINALDSSFSNAIYEINITNNPMLATCCGLFDYLQNPQSSFSQEYFSNNLPGCNSKQEIIDACGISVCSGDVILESQAEVDAFQGCEIIEGSLQIRSPFGTNGASSDITDLSNLLSLTKVTGTIGIDNCDELYNLHGLENVTSSNGIAVNNCDKINDLSALSGISGEASVVYIYGNSSLTNIDGLEGITVLHNSLSIESNPVLQNVDGLANLKEVNYAHFTIIDNPSLENIHGLGNLETVNTTLFIQRCDALGSLDGLNKLTTTVRLVVSGNDMLTDISALSSLTNVENEFLIVDNPLLSDCCILTDLLNSSAIGGPISIENNAPGCNSEQDIETSCGPVICTGDVILESQAEVDAFPGCEIIEGQLVIEGGDISDLTPLSSLKEIRKVLVIRNNSNLLTLNGLNNLTTIGGLAVVNNPLLKNLLPLSNVNSDDLSPLVFQKNKAMIDLKGLEGITGVQYLSISENSNLTTLEGLNNLAIGKSDFLVSQNPALENLNGLNSLHTTKDVTGIHNNDVLADISALSQLNSVFVLAINSNPSLTNLSGLENLSDVWTIAITGNDALENLDAFSSLTAITGDLTIIDNPALSDCCGIQPLLNGGGIAGNILIENNPFACGSGFDIINNCGPSGVDLELSMSQPNAAPAQWTTYPVTLTLSNKGDSPATGIVVHFPKPDGVVYAGGNEFSTSQGTFNPFGNQEWVVGKLKEGGTVTLTVNYFLLQSGAPVAYAQVSAVNEEDIDSSPNNGTPSMK
ncbi:MAG: CARDB domain-containing protein [Saprospiraceae bacterium]